MLCPTCNEREKLSGGYCGPCRAEYDRERKRQGKWPKKTKEQRAKDNAASKRRMREFIHSEKEKVPCADCHVRYPYWVMQFDHLGEKVAGINILRTCGSKERVLAEMSKCEVVCANCHANRTYLRTQGLPLSPLKPLAPALVSK